MPPVPLAAGVYFWRLHGVASGTVGSNTGPVWEFFVGARSAAVDTSWGGGPDVNGDGYADVVRDVLGEWHEAAARAIAAGVARSALVMDPGLGFAKSDHVYSKWIGGEA